MMREIVVECDAGNRIEVLEPPSDPPEGGERAYGVLRFDACVPGRRDCRQGILDVVRAALLPLDPGDEPAVTPNLETAPVRAHRSGGPVGAVAHPLHVGPATHRQNLLEMGASRAGHDASGARDDSHDVVELALHVPKVAEDVGMVELEVVQHQCARAVVHEFRPLVEERGVVLVGLDHE